MGKLRTRVGLGAAVVGVGLVLGAPAFADGTGFQITSPQSGATISNSPTVKGLGRPGARVAVEAISQGNNGNHHWNGRPGDNGPGNGPANNGPANNGPGNGPANNGPGNGPSNGPGNGPANNGNWNNKQPESDASPAGRCTTTVAQNGWWSCQISPALRPGRYKIVAEQSMPGAGNDVASVDNLTVPGGQLPVTPGPDPVPVVAGGLVLLAGGAVVVAATRVRRRGKHAA
ncbi:hypothetical protein O7635_01235 [Asanoa sp. WMMD1127]|uniref:hypothetical protein n=1 Tax=Asanoa sp. WMMD1127 TaxID=3016107 RepID=UPI0024168E87|nr:hypothetical protein [Asanoa sp. WMMD1127]MDG4820475.1 hypothetical protein [Asanoa sp. WMMD1127]